MVISSQNPISSAAIPGWSKEDKKADQAGFGRKTPSGKELSQEEKDQVKELRKTDQEVRSHEMAHMAAGGGLVRGGAKFEYQTGPDGRQYAIAGEVSIDTSPVSGDPRATIIKMQRIQSAAMAPAHPSGQDRQVAAQAAATAAKAQMELAKEGLSSGEENQDAGKKGNVKNLYGRDGQIHAIDLVNKGSQGIDIYS